MSAVAPQPPRGRRHTSARILSLALTAMLGTGCVALTRADGSYTALRQIDHHDGQRLEFRAYLRWAAVEVIGPDVKDLELQIELNGTTIIKEQYKPHPEVRTYTADYEGLKISAACESPDIEGMLANMIWCRMSVDGTPSVMLAVDFAILDREPAEEVMARLNAPSKRRSEEPTLHHHPEPGEFQLPEPQGETEKGAQ